MKLSHDGVSVRAFRERLLDLKQDRRLRYILVFKNQGAAAGATLEHPHSQLIALPVVPDFVREEIEGARRHFAANSPEADDSDRQVSQGPHLIERLREAPVTFGARTEEESVQDFLIHGHGRVSF